jgi:hypothetical protein
LPLLSAVITASQSIFVAAEAGAIEPAKISVAPSTADAAAIPNFLMVIFYPLNS